LRPWKPAENDPAEPNALTQSLQLTCSLTPSSTEPSTWLVIIWLKCELARPLTDPPLEPAPVGQGGGTKPSSPGVYVGVEVEVDVEQDVDWANATPGSPPRNSSVAATTRVANKIQLREIFAIVSGRTRCRWDRCRHREALPEEWHPQNP
jgi:hypothetical protein